MSWTAPDVSRIDEPFTGPERGILDGFLDWHRATLLWKCAGLTGEQLALAPVPPSNLSLLGIVRHMADIERAWFRIRRIRPEAPSAARSPHESRHRVGGAEGSRERGHSWRRPRRCPLIPHWHLISSLIDGCLAATGLRTGPW
jgi:Protein of unknown function (DUF664)